jgi:hypothetical protein
MVIWVCLQALKHETATYVYPSGPIGDAVAPTTILAACGTPARSSKITGIATNPENIHPFWKHNRVYHTTFWRVALMLV